MNTEQTISSMSTLVIAINSHLLYGNLTGFTSLLVKLNYKRVEYFILWKVFSAKGIKILQTNKE